MVSLIWVLHRRFWGFCSLYKSFLFLRLSCFVLPWMQSILNEVHYYTFPDGKQTEHFHTDFFYSSIPTWCHLSHNHLATWARMTGMVAKERLKLTGTVKSAYVFCAYGNRNCSCCTYSGNSHQHLIFPFKNK